MSKKMNKISSENKKKLVDMTIESLIEIRDSYKKTLESLEENPVFKTATPFFLLQVKFLTEVIDEYIKFYIDTKKRME